jgi:hypothetical protein
VFLSSRPLEKRAANSAASNFLYTLGRALAMRCGSSTAARVFAARLGKLGGVEFGFSHKVRHTLADIPSRDWFSK